MPTRRQFLNQAGAAIALTVMLSGHSHAADAWKVGMPIVSYWAGPGYPNGGDLTEAAARQLADGGWNLVWCEEKELDVAQRHGLRGLLTAHVLTHTSLDHADKRAELDALIARVKKHPAFYAYHLFDEPSAQQFSKLARITDHLRERDPAHLAYINLLPTYANNEQLGTKGAKVEAYTEHLRQFVEVARPALLSYDHYQLTNAGDTPDYFLNLALVPERAAAFRFDPPIAATDYKPGARVEGVVLSRFGTGEMTTHLFVVNLDYKTERTIGLIAPASLEIFDATTG